MIFRETLLNKKCVFIFSAIIHETFLILKRTRQDTTTNVHRFSRKANDTPVGF